jgi:hypothetical protein
VSTDSSIKDGKINTIKSSDIVQKLFYNPKLLDMTVKSGKAAIGRSDKLQLWQYKSPYKTE